MTTEAFNTYPWPAVHGLLTAIVRKTNMKKILPKPSRGRAIMIDSKGKPKAKPARMDASKAIRQRKSKRVKVARRTP